MKMNRRMLFGIISIALAAVIALIGIPAVIGQGNTKINIVRVKTAIEEGTVIVADSLEMAEVSSHGLPANVATDFAQVVGTYALVDLVPGDYFLPSKVSQTTPDRDPILSKLPDDKIVYFLHHTETDANGREKAKTIGRMLDEKITVEGMFTIVLKTVVQDGKYLFQTHNSGQDTVKSPMGMFEGDYIENDLAAVDKAIREYYDIGGDTDK